MATDIYSLKIASEKAEVLQLSLSKIDAIIEMVASGSIGVTVVSSLPTSGLDGQMVFLTTDSSLYVYNNGGWESVTSSSLPTTATDGTVVFNSSDNKLYVRVNGVWQEVESSSTNTDNSIIVQDKPTVPKVNDIVLDLVGGTVETWNGTEWIKTEYTVTASGLAKIKIVSALPSTAEEGDIVYNSTDTKMYVYINGTWTPYFENIASEANSVAGIEIVAILPLTVTNGKVVYNSADKKLYEGVNGSWVAVVQASTASADVADASITVAKFAAGIRPVETLSALPTTGNSVGRMVYLTTDGQLYRYTATGFTTAVPAQAITGTITATQIADDAITTPKIATGAITADEIGANAITAGKIAVGAVTAGTIQAGAISATEIASNAITTDKIYSGAITAIKLSANSVDATKIVAGSITSDKIGANQILAGHINAGAITAREIASGTITADKIGSRSIVAGLIQAGAISGYEISANAIQAIHISSGAITTNKIGSGTTSLVGGSFSLGEGANVTGYGALGCFDSSTYKFGIIGACSGGQCGVVAASSSSNYASAHFNLSSAYSGSRTTAYLANSSHAGYFANHQSGKGCTLSSMSYALEMNGGGFAAMTGCHDGLVLKTDTMPSNGDIVVDVSVYAKPNVYDSLCINKLSNSPKQKGVVGVCAELAHSEHIPTALRINGENGTSTLDPKYTDFTNYKCIVINAIGEGLMNVCGEGGNIEVGDLITTSSIAGKGMKQDDDLIHTYTVAKAREAVTFATPTTVKQIACIYVAG